MVCSLILYLFSSDVQYFLLSLSFEVGVILKVVQDKKAPSGWRLNLKMVILLCAKAYLFQQQTDCRVEAYGQNN